MSKILKPLLVFVLVTFMIWVAVLWHWESTHRDMTVTDIVLYLGVLPLLVFGLMLALRWAWRSAAERSAQAAAAAAAAPAAAAAIPNEEAAARNATIQLLGAFVASPTGQAPAELLDAAAAGEPRPKPDATLRDDDGLPVMAARIDDLDTDDVAGLLEPVIAATRRQLPDEAHAEPSDHVVRALTALRTPMSKALQTLEPWQDRFATTQPAGPSTNAASMVRIIIGLPEEWTRFEHAVAQAWVRMLATDEGASTITASRFAFDTQTGTGEQLWLKADQLLQVLAREKREDVVVLAACHSSIGDQAISLLSRQQRLFSTTDRPKGLMPGEAAATLVLAPLQWPRAPEQDVPPVHLHRPAVSRRDKSIEAGGRVSADCLRATLSQALAAGRIEASDIGALVCDADQHTPRSTELFGTTLELLAHLDPTEDMRLIGTGNGHTGVASALLVVAAAAERARSANKPTVALTLGDAFMRLALLVRPNAPSLS
jgi:hypothetical protein